MGEWRNSSTIIALAKSKEVSGQVHAPAALLSEKEPLVATGYEAGLVPRPGLQAVE
jgi:hypothetical protein